MNEYPEDDINNIYNMQNPEGFDYEDMMKEQL